MNTKEFMLLRVIKWLCLGLLSFLGLFLLLVIETSSKTEGNLGEQLNEADSMQSLVDQLKQFSALSGQSQQLKVTFLQLDSLSGFVKRADPNLNLSFVRQDKRLQTTLSYRFSLIDQPLYLNLSANLKQAQGFQIEQVYLGDLPIPTDFAIWLAEKCVDRALGIELSQRARQRVENIDINEHALHIDLAPVYDLLAELKSRGSFLSEEEQAFKYSVLDYLHALAKMQVQQPPSHQSISAMHYLTPLFELAHQKSRPFNAHEQNKAALLAMAIFSGSQHFARLAGGIDPEILQHARSSVPLTLHQRQDLYLHFIFSAVIEANSNSKLSFAIGEFKELLDRHEQGSGFSFVDLCADLAGTQFARLATDPETAYGLQLTLNHYKNENSIIPSIEALPEGLTKEAFANQFESVESPMYQQQLQQIQQRLATVKIAEQESSEATNI